MKGSATWRRVGDLILDGCIKAVQDGNHGGSHPKASEYVSDGIPFVMASDIRDGRLRLEDCKRLVKSRTDQLRVGFARSRDVLLTHKGTVGEVAIVPDLPDYVMLTPQVTYYRVDDSRISPEYLSLAFRHPNFQTQLLNISAQSTRNYVAISTQRHLEIPWFDIGEQRRIASILSAYDDLIEVNRRRLAILEEMARRLFEEWFVHLRFPGYETIPVNDTPDGPLPDGWAFRTLRDLVQVNQTTLRPTTTPERIRYVDIASVSPGRIDHVEQYAFADAPGRARRIVRDGSIIWSTVRPNRRGFAIVFNPEPNLIVSTGFAVLDAVGLPASYLYAWTTTDAFVSYLINHATGAAYPAVTGATFEHAQILVPTEAIADAYGREADPILRLADKLHHANVRLAAARDLILPRLVSGELSVADAPISDRLMEAAD